MAKKGRIPTLYMRVLRFLRECKGYENGKTIDEIAQHIYNQRDFEAKARARQLIGAARKSSERSGYSVDLFSVKPVGMPERRYCHLSTVAEYTKVINDFEAHMHGSAKTQKELERLRITAEKRVELKKVRKARSKKARKQTA